MQGTIRYLQHKEIDKQSWDNCIDNAPNGLIYAQSEYLDGMCTNWDGLVLDNYDAVMPLPWRRKWGLCYLYQPYFTASLGVFAETISEALVQEFIRHIPKKFIYWDIMFNEENTFSSLSLSKSNLQVIKRNNYVLNLKE
ncbi:MAG TPA: hypothetical protein VM935_16800, partial [Chitinophagaceae bacterium]|nr:hypothetical protein [Chitinophagaceae bacterium]